MFITLTVPGPVDPSIQPTAFKELRVMVTQLETFAVEGDGCAVTLSSGRTLQVTETIKEIEDQLSRQ